MFTFKQTSSGFNPASFALSIFRLILILPSILSLLIFHEFFSKLLFIDIVKRYLTCITNLICIRWILIILGFFKFQNDSFKFFTRSYNDKFTLRSGYIGVANHHNIIDFLFYTYLISPTYVKILIVKYENGSRELLYIPLTFMQAVNAALSARGFEPIVIEEKELNRIKERKLHMHLLVVETFENLRGPILVLLPGINSEEFIPVDRKLVEVINSNESKFNRWTVGLCAETPSIKHIYMNQVDLVFDLLEKFSINSLKVEYCQFHKSVNYEMNFSEVISRFMTRGDENKVKPISYEAYITQMSQKEEEEKSKGKSASAEKQSLESSQEQKGEEQSIPLQSKQKAF